MTGSLNSGLLPEEDTTTMHTFDTIIVISIACCIGFVPAIYVKKDPILAIGYFVASTIGAFAGSHLVLRKFTQFDKPGIVFGGIVAAIILVTIWHFVRKDKAQDHY